VTVAQLLHMSTVTKAPCKNLDGQIRNQVGIFSTCGNHRLLLSVPDMFATLCTVEANTSQMIKAIKPRRGRGGTWFYEQKFSVVLLFGLTELKAQLSWMEDVSTLLSLHCATGPLIISAIGRREAVRIPCSSDHSYCPHLLIAILAGVQRELYTT